DGSRFVGYNLDARTAPIGISVYSMRTGRHERVADHGMSPLWLRDGRHVVFFDEQSIGILDVDTRDVTTPPFAAPEGLDYMTFRPFVSSEGSTLYVRQTLEQGNVWMIHFEK